LALDVEPAIPPAARLTATRSAPPLAGLSDRVSNSINYSQYFAFHFKSRKIAAAFLTG
jgi:hypothetical protein